MLKVSEKIPVHQIDPTDTSIYVRRTKGLFQSLRFFGGFGLFALFFGSSWLTWQDRQAILFDIPNRQFHFWSVTFWPQDFMLLTLILITLAFTLFFVTVFAGRIWCGYTCPQSVWTWIFIFIEEKVEGSRQKRIRQDQQAMTGQLLLRKASKHLLWLLVGLVTGLGFVGYFAPIRDLSADLLSLSVTGWPVFWLGLFTLATYLNAGWMREKVCIYICPYARFQSVMFDSDTLIVSYDTARGEPRGARKKDSDHELGSCIDCELCVQVCPVGIDIRDGLQYECISCAACVDACDSVMDKLSYPRGLIRYTTENALAGKPTHWLRPRLFGYGLAIASMIGIFLLALNARVTVDLSISRDRQQINRLLADDRIENNYTLMVMNLDSQARTFELVLDANQTFEWQGPQQLFVAGASNVSVAVSLRANAADFNTPSTPIHFRVQAADDPKVYKQQSSSFISSGVR